MTLQAERPLDVPDGSSRDRHNRRGWIAAAAVVMLAAGAVSVAYFTDTSNDEAAARVVLGKSLAPVPVYRVERFGVPRASAHADHGERLVPVLGRPGEVVGVGKQADQMLHVQYAHVRSVAGATQIELAAPREAAFHASRTGEQHYVALIDGKAAVLFFVFGSDDRTNFAVGGGPDGITPARAVTFAHRVTTAVLAD